MTTDPTGWRAWLGRRLIQLGLCLHPPTCFPDLKEIVGEGSIRLSRCHNIVLDDCAQITLFKCGGIMEINL